MTTHGGARAGAGRPAGGISQTRRLIASAIQKGLAQAGRQKYPGRICQDDEEQAAVQTAAMIVDDMIQAGQGNDVMKLWATVAMKEGEAEKDSSRNTLAAALSRLPAAGHVADMSQTGRIPLQAAPAQGGTTHTEGEVPQNQPYFAPQTSLALPDPAAPHREPQQPAQLPPSPAASACSPPSPAASACSPPSPAASACSPPAPPPGPQGGATPPCPAPPPFIGGQENF